MRIFDFNLLCLDGGIDHFNGADRGSQVMSDDGIQFIPGFQTFFQFLVLPADDPFGPEQGLLVLNPDDQFLGTERFCDKIDIVIIQAFRNVILTSHGSDE